MARSDEDQADIRLLAQSPHVRLLGSVAEEMLTAFHDQIAAITVGEGAIGIEMTTTGGDADIGRRLALEVGLARERLGRRLVFIGKTVVYSAGTTVMSGFPRNDRFLTRDAVLLVHCRQLEKTLDLGGPLGASRNRVAQLLGEIENGLLLEREGYAALIEGSDVSMEEISAKAQDGWYIQAEEACARRLVAGLI